MRILYALGGALLGTGLGIVELVQQRPRRQHATPNPVAAPPAELPADIMNTIVALADKETMLALFGASKQLRDAVLGRVATGSSMPVHTCLYLTTDMAAEKTSRLLQLAASSKHDVHVHISGSSPASASSDTALLQSSSAAPDSSSSGSGSGSTADASCSGSSSSSTSGTSSDSSATSASAAAWLSDVFGPWVNAHTPNKALQRITSIRLEGMSLDHPTPLCIGRACSTLKSYALHNVTWPQALGKSWIWPELEQLTLSDTCPLQMPSLFRPSSMPRLNSLHVKWSKEFDEMQRSTIKGSGLRVGACCVGFRHQLTSLTIEGVPWRQFMLQQLDEVFPQLQTLHTSHPVRTDYDVCTLDHNLQLFSRQAPNLEQVHIGVLYLTKHAGLQWDNVRQLKVDAIEGDVISTLARLPAMPALRVVSLPVSGMVKEVVVGKDWVSDVAKLVNFKPISLGEPSQVRSLASIQSSCVIPVLGYAHFHARALSGVMSYCKASKVVQTVVQLARTLCSRLARHMHMLLVR